MGEIRESIILEVATSGAVQESRNLQVATDRMVDALEEAEDAAQGTSRRTVELGKAEKEAAGEAKRATEVLDKQGRALDRTDQSARRAGASMRRVADGYRDAGRQIGAFALPLTRIAALFGAGLGIREVIGTLSDFDRGLSQVQSISSATADELERIKQVALELGGSTSKTASEALQGGVQLARAGFTPQEIPEALPDVLRFAVAEQLELARAAEISGDTMKAYNIVAEQMSRVTDSIAVTSRNASTNTEQIAEALGYAAPLASAYGVSLEQTLAALGAMAEGSIKASRAGTSLSGVMRRIISPTEQMRAELESVGLSVKDLDPRFNDFGKIVDTLGEAFRRGANFTKLFEAEAAAGAINLGKFADKYDDLLAKQLASNDAAGAASKALGQDLKGKIDGLSSAFERLVLGTGENGLTGSLAKIVDTGTETIRLFSGMSDGTSEFAGEARIAASVVEGLVATLAGGALLRAATSILTLSNPITLIASGLGAAVFAARAFIRETDAIPQHLAQTIAEAKALSATVDDVNRRLAQFDRADPSTDRQRARADALATAINKVRFEVENLGDIGANSTQRFASIEELRKAMQQSTLDVGKARRELDAYERRLQSLAEAEKRTGAGLSPSPDAAGAERARLQRQIEQAQQLRDAFKGARVVVGERELVPTELFDEIAKNTGLVDELAAAEARAVEGFVAMDDASGLLVKAEDRARELKQSLLDTADAGKAATDAIEELRTSSERPFIDTETFGRSIRVIQAETEAMRKRKQVIVDAIADGRDFRVALQDLNDEQEIRARAAQIEADIVAQGNRVTIEQRAQILQTVEAYVLAKRASDDYLESVKEQTKAAAEATRATSGGLGDALRRGVGDLDRADQLATSLEIEAAAYLGTRDAVEALAFEEDLRHLQVSEQTKERLRGLLQETQALRDLRDLSEGVAGGFGDTLRALKDGASGREALAAGLQSTIDATFELSVSKLQEQLASGLTSGLAGLFGLGGGVVPGATPGEQGIIQAVQAVERAVISTGGVGGDGGGGGSNSTTASTGFDFGGFASSLAVAGITAGISLMLARSSRDSGGEYERQGYGFGARDPRGGTTVIQNNRTTIQASGSSGRDIARTVRQAQADQRRRWSGRG